MKKRESNSAFKRQKAKADYCHLSITVDDYEIRVNGGINIQLAGSRPYTTDQDEFVHTFETNLKLYGFCTYPEERANHRFTIELYGKSRSSGDLELTVKDLYERNEYGTPQFKKYRDGSFPILREPPGIGVIDKVRGENRWNCWLIVGSSMVRDAIILLSTRNPVYASLSEMKLNRIRHVRHLAIQTTNPDEE